jgi:hypothetical protein
MAWLSLAAGVPNPPLNEIHAEACSQKKRVDATRMSLNFIDNNAYSTTTLKEKVVRCHKVVSVSSVFFCRDHLSISFYLHEKACPFYCSLSFNPVSIFFYYGLTTGDSLPRKWLFSSFRAESLMGKLLATVQDYCSYLFKHLVVILILSHY